MQKKKVISWLAAGLFLLGLCLVLNVGPVQAAVADTFTANTVEGVTVEYKVLTENPGDHTGTIQVGTGLSGDLAIDAAYAGIVTIPATVVYNGITYTVTEIAYKAMYNCNLTGIHLPNTVSVIGAFAFNATDLTQIELPLSLTRIGGFAFANCQGLETVVVPEGTAFIGGSAFIGCSNLTSVTLPDSLTELNDYLFKDCVSLDAVTLGSAVQNIGYQAFYGCSALTEITLPASVTEIRSDAFRNCSALANVYFDGNCPTLSGSDHFVGVASPAYGNVYETATGFPLIGQDLYGLTIRQRGNNAQVPLITSLSPPVAVRKGAGASLTVNASVLDGGTLSYQWYVSSEKQNTGGTLIPGATNFTYVLPTDTAGVDYYYVVVTNTNTGLSGNQIAFTVSSPITVAVYEATDAETPVITVQPADITVDQGTAPTLSVTVAPLSDGGTLSYAWYENTVNSYSGGTFVSSASSVIAPYLGVRYYYVVVTNTNTIVSGTKIVSATSDIAKVTVNPLIHAKEPEIVTQPQDADVAANQPVTLSVSAVSIDDGELSYQWYSTLTGTNQGGTSIPGATEDSYSPATSAMGTYYYYVIITNTNNDLNGTKTATKTSDYATVVVSGAVYSITVQNDGHGTAGAVPNPASPGQTVQLNYLADSGYQFKEWQVISGEIFIQPNNTFMMPASAVTVKAVFEDIPDYTVTVSDDGNGEGSADPAAADAGVTVTITAENDPGYIFKAWQVISGGVTLANSASATTTFTMPAGNVEVRATFETPPLGMYTFNLQTSAGGTAVCDGGSGLTAVQSALVNLWVTPNSGYIFKEWQLVSGTFEVSNIAKVNDTWYNFMMPASNLVLKAVFEATAPVTYTVTFDANGGSGVMSDQTYTAGVAQALTPNAFTRTDYTFDGWATSAAGSVVYTDGQSVTLTANTTLYAVWSAVAPDTYTVTFDANGGSGSMSDQTYTAGVAQALTANAFTRTDYTFDGWALSAAGSVFYANGQSVTLTENTTLYAVWSVADPDTYTVTFDANGGSGVMSDQTFTEGVAQALTANAFTRTDYNFLGWAQTPSGGVVYTDGESITVEYDRTLYAVWASVTAPQFTVTFDANGGSGTMSPQIFQGVSQPLTANAFTRTNYTFLGWALSSTAGGVSFYDREILNVGGDTILYAVWSAVSPDTYTVTFDANGGSGVMSDQTFTEGVAQALTPNAFTRTDYTFDGWATSAAGSVVYIDGQSVTLTASTTLYAVWSAVTPDTYTVTVQDDGNGTASASPNPAAEGETVTLSNTPDPGYQFDEWQVISGGVLISGNTFTMPDNDVTVKAVFKTAAPPALVGNISEIDKSGIGLGDTIYMGNAGGVPISWRIVSGSGSTGSMTLLATRKVDDVIEFDRDPDGEAGPETPSNNYRDSDLRDYLNNNFASSLNGAERSSVIKVRVFDADTGVSLSNTVADENGDYSYIPNESQVVNWNSGSPGVNQYWSSYWVRDPDLNPHEGYMIRAEGGGKMRVFLTSEYAPRPAVVIGTSLVAAVSQIVDDNTNKPWALQEDGTNYAQAATGKAYMIGISSPADLSITGIPGTKQTTNGSSLQLNGLSPSINDGSASIVYLIYKKSDGSILQYQTIEADGLSSLEIDAAGIPTGSGYAVRMWLQKNTANYSPALSPFYTFDLEISAEAPTQYTVTFNANGGSGTMSPQTFTSGAAQALKTNTFTRTDYTFLGWATSASGNVVYTNGQSVTMTANTTLYAVWGAEAPTTYTVTFNANGGSGTMSPQTFTEGVAQALKTNAFTRTGYNFLGWAESASGSVVYTNGQSVTMTANKTFYAVWSAVAPTTYTVTFNANGGSGTMSPQTFTEGVAQALKTNAFTRTGYNFLGWATSPFGSVVYTNGQSVTLTANTTLYAVWSAVAPTTYTVTFNANGGSGSMSPQTFTAGVAQALKANAFTRTGYTFLGWATSAAGSVVYTNGQSVTMTANTTLYAVWSAVAPTTYTVTFNANGGSGTMSPQTFAAGVAQALKTNAFTRTGYTFLGWATSAAGSVVYTNGQSVTMTANTTLYAVWSAVAPTTYTVTFNANGGSGSMSPQTFTQGVAQALKTNAFTRTDYTFLGWATTPTGGVMFNDRQNLSVESDMVLYAVWAETTTPTPEAPTITTTSLPNATVGKTYNATLAATGTAPITWGIDSGSLPTGLILSTEGVISGTPTTTGTANFTVKAVNSFGEATKALSITVKSSSGGGGGGGGGGISKPVSYPATPGPQPENGSISTDKASAPAGSKVTITATPDKGYIADKIFVTDKNGKTVAVTENQDGTYSFIMPAGGVTITASFVAEQPEKPALSFTDVKEGDWFSEYVKYVCEKGLMVGTAENRFSPNLITSRSMLVSILYRMAGSPSVSASSFRDVAAGQWYTGGIAWATANGIAAGYGNGLFGPSDNLTREQLAVILYNYAKYKGYAVTATKGLSSYTDQGRVSPWAKTAMEWAVGSNLLFGKGNNTLAPADVATRAEMAAIIQRFIENVAS